MEFTKESIDSLAVNEVDIMKRIAEEMGIKVNQVAAVISLVNEGCTIPFISRYRKEKHGSLDEVQVRDCDHNFKSYSNIESRRIEIIKSLFNLNKLTDALYSNVMNAKTMTELDDLWAPFKKKKKTRGMIALDKGLEPLASAMLSMDDDSLVKEASKFVVSNEENPELSVASVQDALDGAKDINAELVSQNTEYREAIHDMYIKHGSVKVKGIGDEEVEKTSTYKMYWDYEEPLSEIKAHRILAINRGEKEKQLEVTISVDVEEAVEHIQNVFKRNGNLNNKFIKDAVEDGVVRLLSPAIVREIRGTQSDDADIHSIGIFSENLKNLLMTQPIKGTRVLGVDPGIRTGTKCAALDETGKYLGYFVINQVTHALEGAAAIRKAIKDYNIQLVAIGNGTGTREVQELVAKVISENFPEVLYTVVDEDGASVYSASDTAREEFPDLDLTIRGAISIGRRLQDPLAELVKIDPKSIGVGLYQHDVNQKKLSEMLDEVVSSVVNNVGVNINTASCSLLKYVSGINGSLAKKIVAYRDEHGKILTRKDLMKVPGMGPKSFEQCAGFLKVPESEDPLDNTWVHPENYKPARIVYDYVQQKQDIPVDIKNNLKDEYDLGEQTIKDIIDELKKPNRDPRDGYPKPIMQKGIVAFEDLKEGMLVTGKIKNVVDFGAFVDLGIKETALLHISELSDSFVSDPMELLKVGDIKECRIIGLDRDRRRISLSLKTNWEIKTENTTGSRPAKKVVKVVKTGNKNNDSRQKSFSSSDDGMSYNPFAALLKK